MIFVSLRARKSFSISLALALLLSLTLAKPADAAAKVQKSAAKAKKSTKSNKSSRSNKSSKAKRSTARASKSSSKKGKVASRGSNRLSKSKKGRLTARGRTRSSRSRWRNKAASATPVYRRSGIHNFLTQSWAEAQSESATTSSVQNGTPTLTENPAPVEDQTAARTQPAQGLSQAPLQILPDGEALPLNPLVAAYADSLSARGFNAENQGFIVSTMDGEVLAEQNADRPFNPASVVKVATSLVAISKLGPDFRFRTSLYTDGALDPATGVLHGSLYVIGSGDPAFFYENAMLIADKLNRSGIYSVEGDLVVLGQFYFNFSASREVSARAFRTTLTQETWTNAARSAYSRFLSMRAADDRLNNASNERRRVQSAPAPPGPPSVKIAGETKADSFVDTTNLKLLAVHTSLPLVKLLKGLNDFSNNWMASVIGNLVGGPDAVGRFLSTDVGLKDEEAGIVTASGLGSNYISPRGTIQIIRKLITYLEREGLSLQELLPVAGIDAGTLERRFTDQYRGAVVAKTGTLSGVSALAGVAYTRTKGPLLFVIYNRGGSAYTFRTVQDETIKKLITFFGGPAPVRYSSIGGARVSQTPTETQSTTQLPK